MKILVKILKTIVIIVWAVIAVATTICLISLNDFGVTELGKKTIFVIDDDSNEPEFKEGDLVIATKLSETKYSDGDNVFYYLDNSHDGIFIKIGNVKSIDRNNNAADTFHFAQKSVTEEVQQDDLIASDRIIGKTNEVKVYHKLGSILNILESKIGFLFLIILPTIFATVFEVYSIVEEVKSENEKED